MQADFELFSCTIKKNVKLNDVSTVKPSTYEELLTRLRSLGVEFTDINFEDDSKGLCHIHCVASIRKGVYRKQLLKDVSPFHVRLDKIYDLRGWLKYAKKNATKKNIFKVADKISTAVDDVLKQDHVSPPDVDTPIDDEYTFKIPRKSMFKRN